MQDQLKHWDTLVVSFLAASRAMAVNAYKTPQLNVYTPWPTSKAGGELCVLAKNTWTATVALWCNPNACIWDQSDLLVHGLNTQTLIEAMTNDYVYKTNSTVPSGPLWDYLEQELDMPVLVSRLLDAFDERSKKYPHIPNDMRITLALTALCRPNIAYPLNDSVGLRLIWEHVPELKTFWCREKDVDGSCHTSLVRAIQALPSSIGEFYAYAAKGTIPNASVVYAFEHFTPLPDIKPSHSNDITMTNWCGWLSTLQNRSEHWHVAKLRWPETTEIIQIVHSLEEPTRVGRVVWDILAQQKENTPGILTHEVVNLFGVQNTLG